MIVNAARLLRDGDVVFVGVGQPNLACNLAKRTHAPNLVMIYEAGVIGALAGIIGTIQATEALKLVLGIGRPLTDRLMDYDAKKATFREIKTKRNPNCPVCSDQPTITTLVDYEQEACELRPSGAAAVR